MSTPYIQTLLSELDNGVSNCKNLINLLNDFSCDLKHVEGLSNQDEISLLVSNAKGALFSAMARLTIVNDKIKEIKDNE